MKKGWQVKAVLVVFGAMVALSALPAAAADDFKHFGVRVRGLAIIPDEKVDSRLSGYNLEVKSDLTPELDLEYFITKNISSELILGVSKHDILSNGNHLGSTWLLPPTLTVKYHPLAGSTVSPYVGIGMNYVIPYSDRANGFADFHIKNSLGWAAQVGADVALGNSWYLNCDLKYLDVDTDVRIGGTEYSLKLNPYVIGTGVGYRF